MKKVAVILSGCGFLDGAEITEAISTLIAIGQNGARSIKSLRPTKMWLRPIISQKRPQDNSEMCCRKRPVLRVATSSH